MKRVFFIVVYMAAFVAAFGLQQGYVLSRAPKVGQESRYRLHVEIDLNGIPATISALVVEKVLSVSDGKYVIESVQKQGKAKHGDLEQSLPDSQADSAVYLVSGEPAEIKSGNEDGLRGRLARMSAFVVPDKPVKAGDSWSHSFSGSVLSGGIGAKAEYKAEAVAPMGAKQALVVQFHFKETSGSKPAEAKGKVWVDVDTGERLKIEGDWKNAPMLGAGTTLDAKVSLVRVE